MSQRWSLLALFLCVAGQPVAAGDKKPDPRLDPLLAELKGGDATRRLKAVMELSELGPAAAPAAPLLVKILEEKNEDLRLNSALALSKIGAPAVPEVEKALTHKDDDVRFYAVWALGWIGPPAKSAAGQVVKMLADPSENVRRKAAFALGKLAPDPEVALKALVAAFGDKTLEVRQAAADAVAQFKAQAVPALRAALADMDANISTQALRSLESIGPEAKEAISDIKALFLKGDKAAAVAAMALAKIGKEAIPALKEGLKSERSEVRSASVDGLAKIGADAVPELVDALGSTHVEVRRQAAQLLGPLRVSDRMVVVALAHALGDKDSQVVTQCLLALRNLGVPAKEAAPKVLALLERTDLAVRQYAFMALESIRADGKDVLPVITKLAARKDIDRNTLDHIFRLAASYGTEALPLFLDALKDGKGDARLLAVSNLGRMGGDLSSVVDELDTMSQDADLQLRRAAVQCLARAGDKAIKPLQKALKDADQFVRMQAANSLRTQGPAAKPARDELTELVFRDPAIQVRRSAAGAVAAIGEEAVDQMCRIIRETKDTKDASISLTAIQGISGLGEKGKGAVGTLIDALKHASPAVRWNAATALGNIGPAAKAAIPALEAATSDKNPTVQNNAKMALAKIGTSK